MPKEYVIVNAVLEEAGECGIRIPLNTRDTTKEKEQEIRSRRKNKRSIRRKNNGAST